MSTSSQPDAASLDQLSRMIAGGRIAQVVSVAAQLGIPDLLRDGPRTDQQLAEATATHAPSLNRLMRALAALGLVRTEGDGYELTSLGSALRSDTPYRLDLAARYWGHESNWRTWGHLLHSIRTGEAAFPAVFGLSSWAYKAEHPDLDQLFNDFMTVGSQSRQDAILSAYDFSRFATIVDVGGGHGQLLGAILQRYPDARGILFDQTHVVEGASDVLQSLGVEGRCATVSGSFLEMVPPGHDAYILKFILHDWDDDQALEILQAVHRAMKPGAALVAVDRVLPEDRVPDINPALMDLHMLVQFQGRERTESEFRSLFEAAGFRLTRVVPTEGDLSLIEGIPAQAP